MNGQVTRYAAHARITKQSASARLKRLGIDSSKRFGFRHVDELWRQHRRQAYDRKMGRVPESEDRTSFLEAQRRRELAKAQPAELEVRRKSGELIEVETVKQVVFEKGRQVRDAILSVPDRLAGVVAAEMDQAKVHALLTKELHQALEALTS
jgi:phage terminase Nu1 subunit (DNA packaging protein)